jgi:hypothetical protein
MQNKAKAEELGFINVDSYYKAIEMATAMYGFVLTDEMIVRFK